MISNLNLRWKDQKSRTSALAPRFEIRTVEAVSLELLVALKRLIRVVLAPCFLSVLHSVTGRTAHLKVYEHLSLL